MRKEAVLCCGDVEVREISFIGTCPESPARRQGSQDDLTQGSAATGKGEGRDGAAVVTTAHFPPFPMSIVTPCLPRGFEPAGDGWMNRRIVSAAIAREEREMRRVETAYRLTTAKRLEGYTHTHPLSATIDTAKTDRQDHVLQIPRLMIHLL